MHVLISNEAVVKTNVLPKSVVSALLEDLETRHTVTKMSGHCIININDEYTWDNITDIYNTIVSHVGSVEGTVYNRLVYCFAEDAAISKKKSDIPNLDNEYVKHIFASDNLQSTDDNWPSYARVIETGNVRNIGNGNNWPIKSDNGIDYYYHRFSQQNGFFCTIRLLEKNNERNTVSFAIELHIVRAGSIDYQVCKVQQIFYIREFPIPKNDRPLGILNRAIDQFDLKDSRSLKSLIAETEAAASKILAFLNRTGFYPTDQDTSLCQLSNINLRFNNIVTNVAFIGYDNQTFNTLIEQYPRVISSRKLRTTKNQYHGADGASTPKHNGSTGGKRRGNGYNHSSYKTAPEVITYNVYLDPDTPYSFEIPTRRHELICKLLSYNHLIMTLENGEDLLKEIHETECEIRRDPSLVARVDMQEVEDTAATETPEIASESSDEDVPIAPESEEQEFPSDEYEEIGFPKDLEQSQEQHEEEEEEESIPLPMDTDDGIYVMEKYPTI